MYFLICKDCGKEFEHPSQFKRLCPECDNLGRKKSSERQRAKRRAAKTRNLSINQIIALLEEYNRKHGTKYTYGQFVELAESGKINVKIKEAEN